MSNSHGIFIFGESYFHFVTRIDQFVPFSVVTKIKMKGSRKLRCFEEYRKNRSKKKVPPSASNSAKKFKKADDVLVSVQKIIGYKIFNFLTVLQLFHNT